MGSAIMNKNKLIIILGTIMVFLIIGAVIVIFAIFKSKNNNNQGMNYQTYINKTI